MRNLDKFFRQNYEEYLSEIEKFLEFNSVYYETIRIRCVARLKDGLWENTACVIQAFKKGEVPKESKSCRYENYCLLEDRITVEKFKEILKSLESKKIIIDGTEVVLVENSTLSSISYLPGLNEYSKNPGLFIQSTRDSLQGSGFPMINWNLPAFPTLYSAVFEWFQMKDLNNWPHGLPVNKVSFFLPECRAWIKEIKMYGKKTLRILIDAVDACPKLKLKGFWKADKAFTEIDSVIARNVIYLKIPPGEIKKIYLYLIDESENIYDFFDDTQGNRSVRDEVLLQINDRPSLKKLVLNARLLGESLKLELKPYLEPNHQKVDELIETVIAFANAKGGTILVGVNNKGEIEGIEKKVSPNHKKLRKELITYIVQVRSLISEGIGKDLEIKTTPVKIGRSTVLAIEVNEGVQKPYSFSKNGKCFIRRGASNMPALPEDIQKMNTFNSELSLAFNEE